MVKKKPKGMLYIELESSQEDRQLAFKMEFIENKKAMIFKTLGLPLSNGDETQQIENALSFVNKQVSELPHGSHIRILVEKDHPLRRSVREVSANYSHLIFTIESKKERSVEKEKVETQRLTSYQGVSITRENILELAQTHLLEKGGPL